MPHPLLPGNDFRTPRERPGPQSATDQPLDIETRTCIHEIHLTRPIITALLYHIMKVNKGAVRPIEGGAL